MGVGSGRLKVADLALRVFDRSVHPEWFSVLEHRRVFRREWEADLRIVEGGHVIVWGAGIERLSEVLIVSDIPLPETGRVYESPVRRERSKKLTTAGRVEYQTCFAAERLEPEVFAHITEELTLEPERGDLVRCFEPTNRHALPAVIRMHVEPRGRGLSIQAFHSFPEEHAIVRVQSLFEVVAS